MFFSVLTVESKAQILAWNFYGNNGNEASVNATTNHSNLAVSTLTRGDGITAASESNTFSATGFTTSNTWAANQYFEFTINAVSGYAVSLATLDVRFWRESNNGAEEAPGKFRWEYKIGSAPTFTSLSTSTETSTNPDGTAQTQINLSSIPALQNVASGTIIYIRLYGYEAKSCTCRKFGLGKSTVPSTNSLAIGGKILPYDKILIFNNYGNNGSGNKTYTTKDTYLESSTLTRGSGLTAISEANSFSATGFTSSSSYDTTDYFECTVKASPGYMVSLATIDAKFWGNNYSGGGQAPDNFRWAYKVGDDPSTAYTNLAPFTFNDTASNGSARPPVNLANITDLQKIGDTKTIHFRLYGYSATGGNFGLGKSIDANDHALMFGGHTADLPTITLTPVSYGPYCFGPSHPVSVSFAVSDSFLGNFQLQLSNATGGFNSGTTILATGSTSPLTGALPANLSPGNYRIRVINPHPEVVSTNDNGSDIVINALPVPAISPNITNACPQTAILLTASGGAGYSWNVNSATTDTTTVIIPDYSVSVTSVTYIVTASTLGCTATSSVNIAIRPATSTVTPQTLCSGGTIFLSATGGQNNASYVWSGPPAFHHTGTPTAIGNAQTSNSGIYHVTISNTNYTCVLASPVITVHPKPVISIWATDSSVCTGSDIYLSASGGTAYAWTGPASFASSLQNPSINNATSANSGTYRITVTDANTCTASATLSISVLQKPTVSISGSLSICKDQTSSLEASVTGTDTPYSYAWSNSQTGPSISISGNDGSQTYSVTVTGANGCTSSASAYVTVRLLPQINIEAVSSTNTNGQVCYGGDITLTAEGSGTVSPYSYNWSNGENVASISLENMTGDTDYTVTVTDHTGCSATESVAVTVTPLPTPQIVFDPEYLCYDNTVIVSIGNDPNHIIPNEGYQWKYDLAGEESYNVNGVPAVTLNGNQPITDLYVTVTDQNGCSGTAAMEVDIYPLPEPTVSASSPTNSNGEVCAGSDITLTAGGAGAEGTYEWSGPNSYINTGSSVTIEDITSDEAGTYVVTVTTAYGCTSTTSITVTVHELPAASISPSSPSPICYGGTVTLNASPTGGYSYQWYHDGNEAGTDASVSLTQVSESGSYTVVVTNAETGCVNTASSVSVTIKPLPTPTASATPNPICSGQTIQFTASAESGSTYSWSGPQSFSSTQQNPTRSNMTSGRAGTYRVTATLNGCTATASVVVTVNPLPDVSISPAYALGAEACEGATIVLTASPSGSGYTYQWTNNGNPISGETGQVYAATASGNYNVIVTNSNGCSDVRRALTIEWRLPVTIHPTPVVSITPAGPIDLCAGDSEVLTVSSTEGGTFVWKKNGTPIVPTYTGSTYTASQSGSYSAVQTTNNGCFGESAPVVVSVHALPGTPEVATVSPDCGETTGSITVTPVSGYEYSISGGESYSTNNVFTGLAPGEYTVVVKNEWGCESTTVVVTIDEAPPMPEATAWADQNTVCTGAVIALHATGGNTYAWSGPTGFSSTASNPSITGALSMHAGTYTVTVTGTGGCTATAQVTISVNPLPAASLVALQNPVCEGSTLSLTASGGGTYAWSGPEGFSSSLRNPSRAEMTGSWAGIYTVTVTAATGCTKSATISINMNTRPAVFANATPNPAITGNTVSFTSGTGTKYKWAGPLSFTSTLQNPTRTNIQLAHAGTYSVTVTAANNCSNTATLSLAVNPPSLIRTDITETEVSTQTEMGFRAIPGVAALRFTVSPVPMRAYASFRFEQPTSQPLELTLYTIDGRMVRYEKIAPGVVSHELYRESLHTGTYLYSVTTTDKTIVQTGKLLIAE